MRRAICERKLELLVYTYAVDQPAGSCGYLSGCRASSSFRRYQIILLWLAYTTYITQYAIAVLITPPDMSPGRDNYNYYYCNQHRFFFTNGAVRRMLHCSE